MPANRTHLRPRDVAEQLDVKLDTVLAWIRNGTLAAVNVAQLAGKRPRWRISADALETFLGGRAALPIVRQQRRQRRKQGVTNYF